MTLASAPIKQNTMVITYMIYIIFMDRKFCYQYYYILCHTLIYCKRGKICWAKLLQILPKENFCGALGLKHLNNAIILNLIKYSRINLCGTLENREKCKFSPANLSLFTATGGNEKFMKFIPH